MRRKTKYAFSLPVRQIIMALSAGLIALSLYQIWHITTVYKKEDQVRRQMQPYSPQPSVTVAVIADSGEPVSIVNPTVAEAVKLNPDIIGWLRLDGTGVDYPFVQAADNDYYLRRDVNKEYSYAGTLFMDANCSRSFSQFSAVIYGHNMLNGTMFSDILKYKSSAFFNSNNSGTLFLENATYQLDIFAYLEVPGNDAVIYQSEYRSERDMQNALNYIAQTAQRYRELSLTPNDRLVILSTCTDNLDEMRSVLAARLVRVQ